jgi:hypothetical protein
MDKEHQKRGKKAYTGSPKLIYMTSCKRRQGERNHQRELPLMSKGRERKKKKRNIRSMKTGGAHEDRERLFKKVYCQGSHSFLLISKGKRNIIEKYQKHEDRGSKSPKESYPFPLMSKGERNMRREISRALVTGEYECFHQFQRGRLLES